MRGDGGLPSCIKCNLFLSPPFLPLLLARGPAPQLLSSSFLSANKVDHIYNTLLVLVRY